MVGVAVFERISNLPNIRLAAASIAAKMMARESGHTLKTYSMTTLAIGETDRDAEEQAALFREGFDEGALRHDADFPRLPERHSPVRRTGDAEDTRALSREMAEAASIDISTTAISRA